VSPDLSSIPEEVLCPFSSRGTYGRLDFLSFFVAYYFLLLIMVLAILLLSIRFLAIFDFFKVVSACFSTVVRLK
jgi:hypothetical protein